MSIVDEIKKRVSIIDIATDFTNVKKIGKYYKISCPYHNENEPSMVLYETTNRFKCFGCQVSGSQIDLYAKFNALTFNQAVHQLAKHENIAFRDLKPVITITDYQKIALIKAKMNDLFCCLLSIEKMIKNEIKAIRNIKQAEKIDHYYHALPIIQYWLDLITYDQLNKQECTSLLHEINNFFKRGIWYEI